MKRVLLVVLMAISVGAAQAITFEQNDYSPAQTGRWGFGYKTFPSKYYGLRLGVNMTHVASDDYDHSCGRRGRLNIGIVYGKGLSSATPLYLETGLAYIAKGGKRDYKEGDDDYERFYKGEYNLDYLEIPILLRYMYVTSSNFGFHVFLGGYFACGIGGSIKKYAWDDGGYYDGVWQRYENEGHGSFSGQRKYFRRFDAGLKFGVALSYSFVYLEFAYDLGLANINHDAFAPAYNRNAVFNIGVNF